MKDGKAPGREVINAELLKCGGSRLNDRLHEVSLYAWTEGEPQDWRDVLLIP